MTQSTTPSRRAVLVTTLAYACMIVAAIAVYLAIRAYGESLASTEADTPAASSTAKETTPILPRVLLALAAVIVVGQLLGRLLRLLGQPPVIGEVIAGILLGPSLLGPETSQKILPDDVAPYLAIIAQLGVILYMFVVGLELDLGSLRRRAHTTIAISHASIVVPFLLGALLALLLFAQYSPPGVPFTSFSLFLGVAMAITAFPVLARILTDQGMSKTPLGQIALTCAAVDDATAWCLLALVVGVARAETGDALNIVLGTLGFLAAMFLLVRPVLSRYLGSPEESAAGRPVVGLVFALLLLSALATEAIGIHAIFGAFLLGAIIPHDSAVARKLGTQLEDVVLLLLLPAFFAFTGMRTRIDLVDSAEAWLWCGLIILVATAGKFGGTLLAARFTGHGWRDATALGVLMNTRGLMELIVLNVGLDLGVLTPELFSMMVIMALVTTIATTPIVRLIVKPKAENNHV